MTTILLRFPLVHCKKLLQMLPSNMTVHLHYLLLIYSLKFTSAEFLCPILQGSLYIYINLLQCIHMTPHYMTQYVNGFSCNRHLHSPDLSPNPDNILDYYFCATSPTFPHGPRLRSKWNLLQGGPIRFVMASPASEGHAIPTSGRVSRAPGLAEAPTTAHPNRISID